MSQPLVNPNTNLHLLHLLHWQENFFFNHRTTWEAHKLAQNLVDGEFWIICVSTLPQKQQKYLENNSLKSTNLEYWKLSKSTEQAKKCLF